MISFLDYYKQIYNINPEMNDMLESCIGDKSKSQIGLIKAFIEQNHLFEIVYNDFQEMLQKECKGGHVWENSDFLAVTCLKNYKTMCESKCGQQRLKENLDFIHKFPSIVSQNKKLEELFTYDDYMDYYSVKPEFNDLKELFPEIFDTLSSDDFVTKYEWMSRYVHNVREVIRQNGYTEFGFGKYEMYELLALEAAGQLAIYFLSRITLYEDPFTENTEFCEMASGLSIMGLIKREMSKGYISFPYPEGHLHYNKPFIDLAKTEYEWLEDYLKRLEDETNGDFKADALIPVPPYGWKDHSFNFLMMLQEGRIGLLWKNTEEYKEMYDKYYDKISYYYNNNNPEALAAEDYLEQQISDEQKERQS